MNSSEILQDALAERTRKNPAYSIRALARDLDVSHSFLSQVLNRRRALSVRKAVELSRSLGMSTPLAHRFLEAVAAEKRDVPGAAGPRRRLDPIHVLEAERFRAVSSWYHVAILDLTYLEGFRPDPAWIARRLGIRPHEARAAIRRLLALGLLAARDGSLSKAHGSLAVRPGRSQSGVRQFHREMIQKGVDSLRATDDARYARRSIVGSTMPVDPSRLGSAKRMIEAFQKKLIRHVSGGRRTALYQLNIQFFELTRGEEP